MLVNRSTKFGSFAGENGERLTFRQMPPEAFGNRETVEVSLECEDHCFRAFLDRSEVAQLRNFMGLSYKNSESGFLAFNGRHGERLAFCHTNMGEPYREGVDVRVEGVDHFPDYIGPFIESSEVKRVWNFITEYCDDRS